MSMHKEPEIVVRKVSHTFFQTKGATLLFNRATKWGGGIRFPARCSKLGVRGLHARIFTSQAIKRREVAQVQGLATRGADVSCADIS